MVIGTIASFALLFVLVYFTILMVSETARAIMIRYNMVRIDRQARRQPRLYV